MNPAYQIPDWKTCQFSLSSVWQISLFQLPFLLDIFQPQYFFKYKNKAPELSATTARQNSEKSHLPKSKQATKANFKWVRQIKQEPRLLTSDWMNGFPCTVWQAGCSSYLTEMCIVVRCPSARRTKRCHRATEPHVLGSQGDFHHGRELSPWLHPALLLLPVSSPFGAKFSLYLFLRKSL